MADWTGREREATQDQEKKQSPNNTASADSEQEHQMYSHRRSRK